ncbi:MAG: methyltransferase domain-containing protein [Chloroflexota bacterium]
MMADRMSDQAYLKQTQYANADNLNARILIHQLFRNNQEWVKFVFRHLLIEKDMQVLAIGCGNATQWQENRMRFPPGSQFILSDISIGMLQDAREGLQGDPRFSFYCGDAQVLTFKHASFDRVTANHMLYHVPDIQAALQEVNRVLKPEGLFIAATNGNEHLIELYNLLNDFESNYLYESNKHARFSIEKGPDQLKRIFTYVGVSIYESDLWVTDAKLLVDYTYSMWDVMDIIGEERRTEMQAFFQDLINRDRGIYIRKSTGVLLASQQSGLIDSLGILKAK